MESLLLWKKNTSSLEELINSYKLIVNNNLDYAIRSSSQQSLFIIDLALTSLELEPLSV